LKASLALSDEESSTIAEILRAHLPIDVTVHVFGSRASGRVKAWSDLDLVLEGPSPLSISLIAALAEAFEESPLPWKVDIVDRKTVSDGFGRLIDRSKVALAGLKT
jgi:uncharacterized protein